MEDLVLVDGDGDTLEIDHCTFAHTVGISAQGATVCVDKAQAAQIIEHLQKVFDIPSVLQFEMNGKQYQTEGQLVTTTTPLCDGSIASDDAYLVSKPIISHKSENCTVEVSAYDPLTFDTKGFEPLQLIIVGNKTGKKGLLDGVVSEIKGEE